MVERYEGGLMEQPLQVFCILAYSVYTEPFVRRFWVEDTDEASATKFAEQCLCAGKETITKVVEVKETA